MDTEQNPPQDSISNDELLEVFLKANEDKENYIKSLEEVVPDNRNFDIVLTTSESGSNISLLHNETGEIKNLNEYLPSGYQFTPHTKFAHARGVAVMFIENKQHFRGFLFSLFHEVGHAQMPYKNPITKWDDIRSGIEAFYQILKLDMKDPSILKKAKERGVFFEKLTPAWYTDKEFAYKSKRERDAWAFALRKLRKLEQDGFNVFAGFNSVDEIREYINVMLSTYEENLFWEKIKSGDIKQIQKLGEKPTFVSRKHKFINIAIPDSNTEPST